VTDSAPSLAFFDLAKGLHGMARAGTTLIFEDGSPTAVPRGAEMTEDGAGWRASLDRRFELAFSPTSEAVDLGSARVRVCRVTGELGGGQLDCVGTASETATPPAWSELDALRSLSAVFDEENAFLAEARRPRGTIGHGDEIVTAWIVSAGELLSVEDARVSTVYDAAGRQRAVGLELWLPGEDFPRRASGEVVAGTTLSLEGLIVNVAVFRWQMEGREGAGAYDVTIRDEPAAA